MERIAGSSIDQEKRASSVGNNMMTESRNSISHEATHATELNRMDDPSIILRPLVSVVIPSMNALHVLRRCLKSLNRQDYQNIEIIVVDNASTDGTTEQVGKEFPDVRILRSEENLGYSGGCEMGVSASRGTYIVFCDSDTRVTTRSIVELVKVLGEAPTAGIAQSKMLLGSDPSRIESMGGFFTSTGILYQEERDSLDIPANVDPHEIFGAKGAFMMLRRDLYFELGGFDTDFVVDFEDTDLCWRAWQAGYRVLVVPRSVVYHDGSITKNQHFNSFFIYHASKNRICTLIKNLDPRDMIRVLPLHLLITFAGMLLLLFTMRFSGAYALVRALHWNATHLGSTLEKRKRLRANPSGAAANPMPHLRKEMPLSYLVSSGRAFLKI